jgi:hypothetical protein
MKALILFALCSIILFASCKKDDPIPEPTEQEIVTALLTAGTGTWLPKGGGGIITQGVDVTADLFKDFSIKFTAKQIITTGTTPVWLRQDTWQFKSGSSSIIIRGQDDKEITIETISETELVLTLFWDETTFEGGRKGSIKGEYEFTLRK